MSLRFSHNENGFALWNGARPLFVYETAEPTIALGVGAADIEMYRGNFDIQDTIADRWFLDCFSAAEDGTAVSLWAADWPEAVLNIQIKIIKAKAVLQFSLIGSDANRLWLRFPKDIEEAIWGGGEQMSYLKLNGRHFPFWTSEPGVGRDKSTALTQQADAMGNAGGDYWTTNYPQPTWLSSARHAVHLESTAWSALDASSDSYLELEVWQPNCTILLFTASDLAQLVSRLSDHFGRPAPMPDWAIEGAIIGLKAGAHSFARVGGFTQAGAALSGLWCEDWVGIRQTSFGRRLFWDWKWNPKRYPDLPERMRTLAALGIRFLGYVNPYIAVDASLYPEAAERGYFALRQDEDEIYHVDFGEFYCGVVDFTNPDAAHWFSERVIGEEMIDFGLSGWMADFGEYLPTDVRLFDGSDPMEAHNRWPILWAKVNADAIASRGRSGDATFFMRAGFSGVQAYCPLLWAGDQSVDFSRHDGIGTVIVAALSSGLVGNAVHHSDVGGYTSLFGNVRTPELMHRWIDLGAFTPVMRSHEGNRPDENIQLDSSPELLNHFARMSRVHKRLFPYVRALCDEAQKTGLPVQRPLFLHYDDPDFYDCQDQYLYGPDMLVAPVIEAGVEGRRVRFPPGDWVHLWTGYIYGNGAHWIAAPHGKPPVFYNPESKWANLFADIGREFAE